MVVAVDDDEGEASEGVEFEVAGASPEPPSRGGKSNVSAAYGVAGGLGARLAFRLLAPTVLFLPSDGCSAGLAARSSASNVANVDVGSAGEAGEAGGAAGAGSGDVGGGGDDGAAALVDMNFFIFPIASRPPGMVELGTRFSFFLPTSVYSCSLLYTQTHFL